MKKFVMFALLVVTSLTSRAYDVEVDGIYYNLVPKAKIAAVSHSWESAYSGDVIIPTTITVEGVEYTVGIIDEGAFNNCSTLKSVVLPDKLTKINSSFQYCTELETISFPETLEHIASGAFYDCTGIKDFHISSDEAPSCNGNIFKGVDLTQAELSVPAGYRDYYETTEPWMNFGKIVPVGSITPSTAPITLTFDDIAIENGSTYTKVYTEEVIHDKIPGMPQFGQICGFFPAIKLQSDKTQDVIVTLTNKSQTEGVSYSGFGICTILGASQNYFSQKVGKLEAGKAEDLVIEVVHDKPATEGYDVELLVDVYGTQDGQHYTATVILRYEPNKTEIVLADGIEFSYVEVRDISKLTYTRTFNNTNWQALYVPFAMNYEDWADEFEVARLNDVHQFDEDEDGEVDRTALESIKLKAGKSTEPNVPYMIKSKTTGTKTITLTDATLYPAEENSIDCSSVGTLYTFTGTYHNVENMATNGYYAMAGGGLKLADSDAVKLAPFRWYLSITDRYGKANRVKSIDLVFDDGETTSISSLAEDNADSGATYSLDGKRINLSRSDLPKGVYIINGKKTIIK